jgi:hypothetical protein
MSKLLSFVGILVIIGFAMYIFSDEIAQETSKETGNISAIDDAKEAKDMIEEKSMVSTLKEAMELGTAMKCTYALNDSSDMIESWIEGEKVHTKGTIGNMATETIFDGTTQYMWTSAGKQGMKMDATCMKSMAEKMPQIAEEKKLPSSKDIRDTFDTAKNVKCVPAESADFTIPSDITFTDQCAMMQNSLKMMEQVKDKIPAGIMPL